MNKMKKLTAALLAVMVTLPVAACGEKIENSKTDSSSLSESQSADESSGAENSGDSSEGAGDSSGAENGQAEDSSKNEAKQADLQAAEENVVYDEDGQRVVDDGDSQHARRKVQSLGFVDFMPNLRPCDVLVFH